MWPAWHSPGSRQPVGHGGVRRRKGVRRGGNCKGAPKERGVSQPGRLQGLAGGQAVGEVRVM